MVKVRMTTADVAAEVLCLRRLIGMRCANVYDLSPKTYVIKLAKSSGVTESGESEKALLLLESGVRLHTTEFARDKSATPSGFTLKLRKHIRTRRLEDVRQLGIDRVVDFQFGLGEGTHHILLELYAQGNLLLTDGDYNVLTLLRSHRDDEKGIVMMARHHYPVDSCRLFQRTCAERVEMALKAQTVGDVRQHVANTEAESETGSQESKKGKVKPEKGAKETQEKTAGGKKGDIGPTLKTVLGESLGYGPALCEHIILDAGLPPTLKLNKDPNGMLIQNKDLLQSLMAAVVRFEDWLESVVKGEQIPHGYIYMQKKTKGRMQISSCEQQEPVEKIYDEFAPLPLRQFDERDAMKIDTFDAAMDEFFSKIEGQRAEQQRKAQEDSAFSKLDKIRADQTNRVEVLKKEVDQSVHMAELIEYNLDDVDAAIMAVRTALASGMDWKDLARMVKEEKKAGNPVAGLIHGMQLEKNQITLLLSNNLDDMDDSERTQPVNKVEVDLAQSAHANARRWFELKKRHATKQDKTVAAHVKAFKAAEKKTQQQLAQAKSVAAISHLRKVHWFEKFNWFISSENYLVVSGRDAQQNELVVKRYMKKGDLYVHADMHGASSTVIKNLDPGRPIPPLTINQAGCFTVCRSQAWDSKIVTSAWWVEAHQVSKTAPTGEYLTVGSFMVRGKKNFLPPNPLVMGFALLFRLDESSIASHLNERRVRGEGEDDDHHGATDGQEESGVSAESLAQMEEAASSDTDAEELVLSERPSTTGDGINEGDDIAMSVMHADFIRNGPLEADVASGTEDTKGIEKQEAEKEEEEEGSENVESREDFSGLNALLDRALELRSIPHRSGSSSKYGLDALPTETEESEMAEVLPLKAAQRERPYLSKAERRKLKKGGKSGIDSTPDETVGIEQEQEKEEECDSREASASGRDDKTLEPTVVGGKIGRGRKGKLKKIKEKYAEQDEDEREFRMSLLASAGRKAMVPGTSEKDIKGSTGKQDMASSFLSSTKAVAGDETQLGGKVCYKCKKVGHLARDCPTMSMEPTSTSRNGNTAPQDDNASYALQEQDEGPPEEQLEAGDHFAVTKERGKVTDGLSRRARAKAAETEIAALLAEENVVELGEDEREKLTELDSLTGCPTVSDVLLYAVPVCGPYPALQGYKYRVKLTPGAAKKGKAAKTALNVFSHMQEVAAREKELMKAITDPELAACMIGNVKVTAPGLTKLKQSQKKGKKPSSKKG